MFNIVVLGGVALPQPADTPHVAYPFTITKGGVATVDQDSVEEIASCVSAICACVIGQREDAPTFGIPDPLFATYPVDTARIQAAIMALESRARMVISERASPSDPSNVTVTINVGASSG